MKTLVSIIFVVFTYHVSAQVHDKPENNKAFLFNKSSCLIVDSGIIVKYYFQGSCKSILTVTEFIPKKEMADAKSFKALSEHQPKLITMHGSISYDFFYRSKLDTPIAQQNFQQHTERVYLNILFKEKYPLKVAFALRQSNSRYFKNFADVNFQFDQFGYHKNLKQEILDRLIQKISQNSDIQNLKEMIEENKRKLNELKKWLDNPVTLQKIIEEREREFFRKEDKNKPADLTYRRLPALGGATNFKFNTSLHADIMNETGGLSDTLKTQSRLYESVLQQLDSLSREGKELISRTDSVRNILQKNIITARQKIFRAKNENELHKIASDNGVDIVKGNRLIKMLSSVKTFSIGRSMINYTELTAQNIAITGLNIEYHSSYYTAFAAGKIDYRVRDFLNKYSRNNGQYLVLGRIGTGDLEKRALILTVFKGRKNISNYGLNDTIKNQIGLIGYSVESIFKKDEKTSISFEVAKSTKPVTGNFQNNKQLGALWQFKDETNLGINIKGKTTLPATGTRLSGFFRKTGEDFQSFSLFSYNTNQIAWLARADQDLFNRKLTLTGMLRRNDFTNPFTDKTYKTSTVFKSIVINVRIPKYPALSFGYYPGSQLYLVDKETIRENTYYILNGSVVYNYSYKGLAMNSSVVYNQYFNQATDSGFVLYKGTNLYAMQTVFFKKFQFQSGITINQQPELIYNTLEASVDYGLKTYLKLGGGAKFNKLLNGNSYWGERIQLAADVKQLGSFQLRYEKSYIPTMSHSLHPVDIGTVSWYKIF